MNFKQKIIADLNKIETKRRSEVFSDWLEWSAILIQNAVYRKHDDLWKRREDRHRIISQFYGSHCSLFAEMLAFLTLALEDQISDILGEIFMDTGLANKSQYFTPFNICLFMATAQLDSIDEPKMYEFIEPSCGSGGMIIAYARLLCEKGINYQQCLKVTAQDADWLSVYMCYIQLSLLGVRAAVIQGNSLVSSQIETLDPEQVFYTPMCLIPKAS